MTGKDPAFSFLIRWIQYIVVKNNVWPSPKPMLFITIADRNLKKGRIDSAEYYINKANNLIKPLDAPMEGRCNVLKGLWKLYIAKKEYGKSLQYLFKALTIAKKMSFKIREKESYKLIYEAYRGEKNIEKGKTNIFLSILHLMIV